MATLLVVDDDDLLRFLVAEILTEEGHTVLPAMHGADGLAQLDAGARPDLIVLDMRMPVMDGRQFAAELEARQIEIPVLLLTAAPTSRTPDTVARAAGYLSKPFDITELADMVRSLLEPAAG